MASWIFLNMKDFTYEGEKKLKVNGFVLRENDNSAALDNIVVDDEIWKSFGKIFKSSLIGRPYFIKEEYFNSTKDFAIKTQQSLQMLGEFFNYLWFAKDNSSNIIDIGLFWPEGPRSTIQSTGRLASNASGKFENTTFNNMEISYAFEVLKKSNIIGKPLVPKNFKVEEDLDKVAPMPIATVVYNDINRINRALLFLGQAREQTRLESKISYYVLIFECLFSGNTQTEINHQIAERIAAYLGKNLEERLAIYDDIKKLYDIRSKYVHGQKVSKDYNTFEKITPFSIKADNYARQILIKVIMEDSDTFSETDDAIFNRWLLKKVFADKPIPDNNTIEGD